MTHTIPDDNVWKQAARYGDAEAEEHGLPETCRKHGIDVDVLAHVAEQRAMRVALMASGRLDPQAMDGRRPTAIALSPDERRLQMLVLMPAYMDGLYIGWRARELTDDALIADMAAFLSGVELYDERAEAWRDELLTRVRAR